MMLEMRDFTVRLADESNARPVLDNVNVHVGAGEVVGLVGESGSGKSTIAKAAMGSIPRGARFSGTVTVDGENVFDMEPSALRRLRTRTAAMIFQDPKTTLNPVRTVGDFLQEQLRQIGCPKKLAFERMVALLSAVHVSKPEMRMNQFPHELSGGMLQRVVFAAALAIDPKVILADEPTSALDVSTQAEIMSLLEELRAEHGFSVLFITHDLHLAAAACGRVYVMYAGHIVEEQPGSSLFRSPQHPYTRGLLESVPDLQGSTEFRPISGRPLMMTEPVEGCPFVARCDWVEEACYSWRPQMVGVGANSHVACRRHEEFGVHRRVPAMGGELDECP
ncbi:MAG: ABC transporter ATP-binding protein [Brevibacterium sp.]